MTSSENDRPASLDVVVLGPNHQSLPCRVMAILTINDSTEFVKETPDREELPILTIKEGSTVMIAPPPYMDKRTETSHDPIAGTTKHYYEYVFVQGTLNSQTEYTYDVTAVYWEKKPRIEKLGTKATVDCFGA